MFVRRRVRRVARRRRFLLLAMVMAGIAIVAIPLAALGASPSAYHEATPMPTSTGDMPGMDMTAEGTPTAGEQAAADLLVADTETEAARFEDFSVAEAEGYEQATPFLTSTGLPMAHFVNKRYMTDGEVLDPSKPEALMYLETTDGEMILTGVMYTAAIGAGPTPGGPLTMWHTHPDLCFGEVNPETGLRDFRPAAGGTCPAGTATLPFEMMHVWLVPDSGGPFAHTPPTPDDLIAGGIVTADQLPGVRELLIGDGPGGAMGNVQAIRAIAGILNVRPAELISDYRAGKSIAEIAAAQGISRTDLVAELTERAEARIDARVADGTMSSEDAKTAKTHLADKIAELVDRHSSGGDDMMATPMA